MKEIRPAVPVKQTRPSPAMWYDANGHEWGMFDPEGHPVDPDGEPIEDSGFSAWRGFAVLAVLVSVALFVTLLVLGGTAPADGPPGCPVTPHTYPAPPQEGMR